ncbi:CocE/NonD family hydrolase [Streptomyces tubbatahanensis]|uniref:CocE/NonD family hydrolase n=1 Tax=Streptomyces tubbatahanensis TaxID=2923272 RepID=A0ABY3Y1H0_9ACTN|nr:CocE/NonD family hydrolase [Streptomyces tubbatahanensis]UNT00383.1 CocE/NonD family hydrolase [Streptomyces tubbatahanensis]
MSSRTHEAVAEQAWAPPAGKPPLSSRLMRATWRGLPAKQHEAGWEPGLVVPGGDGSPLLTDHYFPRAHGDFPTLLVRSPYGRGLPWSPQYGLLFAEQGFHVLLQSCRGTGGSGGVFDLWRNEAADGRATVSWLRAQPWFNGTLGTVGPSYLGYVQGALASDPPPELKAMVVQVGLHDPYALFYADGALRLENTLAVAVGMHYQHQGVAPFLRATLRLRRRLRHVTTAQPLRAAYVSALGGELPWLEEVLSHPDAEDAYWRGASLLESGESGKSRKPGKSREPREPGESTERLRVPTALITGWYDALADQTLEQYDRLRRAGCETTLLVGPWTHTSALQRGWPQVFAESLAWLRAHLCADPSGLRPTAVRVHLGGDTSWRDLDHWPPVTAATPWYPLAGGLLTRRAPTGSAPVTALRYDPADPTPSLGGPTLSGTAGPRDNRALEARDDVLTFTGPPLTEPLDILGPVSARLAISTDTGYADVFTRLCDVDPRGRSVNICDGFRRLPTAEGASSSQVTVPMSSTAHRFPAGHRIRWQISAGAHPRYTRNPGTGDSPLDATTSMPVHLMLHTDSALVLPTSSEPT